MVMIFKSHAHIIRSSLWERNTMYELNSFGVTSNFIAILRINFCNDFDVIAIIFFIVINIADALLHPMTFKQKLEFNRNKYI